jgi:hypothetical protein
MSRRPAFRNEWTFEPPLFDDDLSVAIPNSPVQQFAEIKRGRLPILQTRPGFDLPSLCMHAAQISALRACLTGSLLKDESPVIIFAGKHRVSAEA